jgi:hypothetical protein
MLLKFSTNDMLNCELVDIATGHAAFYLTTNITSVRVSESADDEMALEFVECRTTSIRSSDGDIVAEIHWDGRKPDRLTIMDEEIISIQKLFGNSSVRFE